MTARAAFLGAAGWGDASATPLAGDASSRRYERLTGPKGRAVLMLCPPDSAAEIRRFIAVGGWLTAQGCSAPRVRAAEPESGLLLLEDFGTRELSRALGSFLPEAQTYAALTELLAHLAQAAPPELPRLDAAGLGDLVTLTPEWLFDAPERGPALGTCVTALAQSLLSGPARFSLRDLQAANLMWLPRRKGLRRFGLLDFQDATRTHPAYDLVSALQDARRDVAPEIEARETARFAALTVQDRHDFAAAYALLGAQRALRILGVLARLARRDGKRGYLAHLPRVWANLQRNLRHPALAPLAAEVRDWPAPDPDRLDREAP